MARKLQERAKTFAFFPQIVYHIEHLFALRSALHSMGAPERSTIRARGNKPVKRRLGRAWPWLVLAGAWLFSAGLFACFGMHNIDSDMASELVLAALLNEKGRLVTSSWYYSTEIRIFSPVMVYQLGLLLFDSWHAAHAFALALLLAVTAASLIFLMRGAGMGEAAPYAAAAVLPPTGVASRFLFTYGAWYMPYFALTCAVLGVIVRMGQGARALPSMSALLLMSLWGGLNGVRMTMVCAAPLMLAALWCAGQEAVLRGDVRAALRGETGRQMAGALAACAGFLAGYAINALVLARHFFFQSHDDQLVTPFQLDALIGQFRDLCVYLGWHRAGKAIGPVGVCACVAIGFAAMLFIAPARLARRRAGLGAGGLLVARFALTALVLGVLVNAVTGIELSEYKVVYYVGGLMLSLACIFALAARAVRHMAWLRAALMTGLCLLLGMQSLQYAAMDMERGEAGYEAVADFLVESGVTRGFATFWNANVLTEASDGAIEVYVYQDWGKDELYPWLQKREHFESAPQGTVFLYIGENEDVRGVPAAEGAQLVYDGAGGQIYFCPDAQAVMQAQRGL